MWVFFNPNPNPRSALQIRSSLQQTSEPRPEPVVVSVQEPVQNAGEDRTVVVGSRLLLSLRGRLAKTGRGVEGGGGWKDSILALVKQSNPTRLL